MYHDLRFIELFVRRKWDKLDKCNTNYRHRLPHVFINRNKLQGCYRDPQTGSQAFELFQLQIETSYGDSVTIPGRLQVLAQVRESCSGPGTQPLRIILSEYIITGNNSFDCNFMREQTVLETHIWLTYNNSLFCHNLDLSYAMVTISCPK